MIKNITKITIAIFAMLMLTTNAWAGFVNVPTDFTFNGKQYTSADIIGFAPFTVNLSGNPTCTGYIWMINGAKIQTRNATVTLGSATITGEWYNTYRVFQCTSYKDVPFNIIAERHSAANVSVTPNQGDAPLTVTVSDTPQAQGCSRHNWDFGDGTVLSDENARSETATHTYTKNGIYVLNTTCHSTFMTSDGNYGYSSDIKIITVGPIAVDKIDPSITWTNPADITYGTALSNIQLNDQANDPTTGETISGNLTYTPDVGTILNASTQKLHVEFNPTDSVKYNATSKDVTINVLKATPVITWDNPADITYGVALDNTQLNAVASITGTFVYTPNVGTILNAGIQTLNVQFTPTDITNYNTVSKDTTLLVTKAIPTITWNNPDDIIHGAKLTTTQLNAHADIGGVFAYTPDIGTLLPVGTQTLHVDFTPTDSVNYVDSSVDVTINVLKETPIVTWDQPVDIVEGTELDSTQLNAIASVPGTFIYTPTAGTVLEAGRNEQLQVIFTPTNSVNYNAVTAYTTVDVLTPVEAVQKMKIEINDLVTSGALKEKQGKKLISKLDVVIKKLDSGKTNKAIKKLNGFVNKVENYTKKGKLSPEDGQSLIDEADAIINAIE